MSFDFSNLQPPKRSPRYIDPIDIFKATTIRDDNIKALWLGQGDILRDWHDNRTEGDVGIVLNTGAGKTLVGLLIAQSLVNELQRSVVYACSSIQLVKQTIEKAYNYGLNVASYYEGQFQNEMEYHRGEVPCIVTYQALFNGLSIFSKHEIGAVIFDDAHTAEHLLRDHFSLRISRKEMPEVYDEIVNLFYDYHVQTGRDVSYSETIGKESRQVFLVPPFEVLRHEATIARILSSSNLMEHNTRFAWAHIRDHQDVCCVLVTNSEVTFTPFTIPISTLSYFQQTVRRIYLSATLSAPDAFVRTFGRVPKILTSDDSAGECERLILISSGIDNGCEDIVNVQEVIRNRKALILVPTYFRSEKWGDIATPPPRHEVADHVAAFQEANPDSSEKLILAARYDGLDLPEDTCRLMVIDDLPMGSGPLEYFQWEKLKLSNSLRNTLASRIVQSFGRISRGTNDYGVVFLTGRQLIRWINVAGNLAALPMFLQKQIELGRQVSSMITSVDDLIAATDGCLSRNTSWVEKYKESMIEIEAKNLENNLKVLKELALSEADFGEALWRRDFENAVEIFTQTIKLAKDISPNTGAWHSMWLGYAMERTGDLDSARVLYREAHAAQKNIPPWPSQNENSSPEPISEQILEIEKQIDLTSRGEVKLPKALRNNLLPLNGNGSFRQTEEALRCLGQYLGFDSTRPDNEFGTGPDVIWRIADGTVLCIEVKSEKEQSSYYRKKDIGQLNEHIQWVKDNTDDTKISSIIPIFVGPRLSPSSSASPLPEMLVIELSEFEAIGRRLVSALTDATKDALPITLRSQLLSILEQQELLWPELYETIEKVKLRDIEKVADSPVEPSVTED